VAARVLPVASAPEPSRPFTVLGQVLRVGVNGAAAALGVAQLFVYHVKLQDGRTLALPDSALAEPPAEPPYPAAPSRASSSPRGGPSSSSSSSSAAVLTVGSRVAVSYPGADGCKYAGEVAQLAPDGTVRVQYDDGTLDLALPRDAIHRPAEKDEAQGGAAYQGLLEPGARVKAPFGPRQVLVRGSVAAVDARRAAVYEVVLENGDRLRGLGRDRLRALCAAAGEARDLGSGEAAAAAWRRHAGVIQTLAVGAAVEAKADEAARWQRAFLVGQRADGTVDLEVASCRVLRHVPTHRVRVPRGESASAATVTRCQLGEDSLLRDGTHPRTAVRVDPSLLLRSREDGYGFRAEVEPAAASLVDADSGTATPMRAAASLREGLPPPSPPPSSRAASAASAASSCAFHRRPSLAGASAEASAESRGDNAAAWGNVPGQSWGAALSVLAPAAARAAVAKVRSELRRLCDDAGEHHLGDRTEEIFRELDGNGTCRHASLWVVAFFYSAARPFFVGLKPSPRSPTPLLAQATVTWTWASSGPPWACSE
jgi:hypothetical protein